MDCSAEEDLELASAVARRYGLSLEVVDLHREYWENVAAYAIDKVRRGLTPNPDVMCNKLIKFGCFERYAGKDFDFTATGHYAATILQNGKVWLGTALDPVKDQTDFLAQIDYLQVSKLMFPLGGLMKQEVPDVTARASASWGRLITTTLSVAFWVKKKVGLLNWKRERYWEPIAATGFILSASVRGWDWAEAPGLWFVKIRMKM